MTAFTLEALLLLFIMFVVGVVAGLMLRRARARRLALLHDEELSFRDSFDDQVNAPISEEGMSVPSAEVIYEQNTVQSRGVTLKHHKSSPYEETSAVESQSPIAPEGDLNHRPPFLLVPEGGRADDLKRLKGIGPGNEHKLHDMGIFHFRQIAAWTPEQIAWVGRSLSFPGRVEREDWVGQAKKLIQKEEGSY